MPVARISSLRIHYHLMDKCAVVRPEGACDEPRTEALAKLANSPLIDSRHLIVDLSHADYVESPGFRWIVRQVRKLEERGQSLVVVGLPPSAERAFRLLRLDEIVPVANTVHEALRKIHSPEAVTVS